MTLAQKERKKRINRARYRLTEAISSVVSLEDDELNELAGTMGFNAIGVLAAILNDKPGAPRTVPSGLVARAEK